jgi:hypothetical protein
VDKKRKNRASTNDHELFKRSLPSLAVLRDKVGKPVLTQICCLLRPVFDIGKKWWATDETKGSIETEFREGMRLYRGCRYHS